RLGRWIDTGQIRGQPTVVEGGALTDRKFAAIARIAGTVDEDQARLLAFMRAAAPDGVESIPGAREVFTLVRGPQP
ncbi:MAG: hypothetical protein J2P19_15145, partial [Pseudonocardia sp.]|nr:hypothetical protein [Pseudonocardia sp.]